MLQGKPVIAAFDFDGTISKKDTFFPFLIYAFGRGRVYPVLAISIFQAFFLRIEDSFRNSLKALLIRKLFSGNEIDNLNLKGRSYAEKVIANELRPEAVKRINWHHSQGHRCVMVSASVDIYLQYIAAALGFNELICTEVSVDHLKNARMNGRNCRGMEKLLRIENRFGEMKRYEIYAYGDSAGDREMIAAANFQYMNAF